MPFITVCPATCELCGNWIPAHSSSCPRNGVHPSQWGLEKDEEELKNDQEEEDILTIKL
ncbi:unnamed protein product [Rhizopus stolonifer]